MYASLPLSISIYHTNFIEFDLAVSWDSMCHSEFELCALNDCWLNRVGLENLPSHIVWLIGLRQSDNMMVIWVDTQINVK